VSEYIYKIATSDQWRDAQAAGIFKGAPVDLQDGFIHFSTAGQVRETARRHFTGQAGLLLLSIDPQQLGPDLKLEPSRGNDLFPHLYGELSLDSVVEVYEILLDENGTHQFPDRFPVSDSIS